jgi:hypothetical protein
MSAFGVILVGLGVLLIWSGVKGQKINEVLTAFLGKPTAQAKTASTGSGGATVA